MSKFIVAVFPDQAKALEGTRILKELHAANDLSLYAAAVVVKEADGSLSVKETAAPGPLGTGVGALVGGLVGLLGGPVGVLIGAGAGALIGSLRDLYDLGLDDDFLQEISRELVPGKVAVVAEIGEGWTIPLDTRMEAVGAVVMRRKRGDFEDDRAARRTAMRRAEVAELKAERAQSTDDAKVRLTAHIDKAQASLQEASERLKKRIDKFEQETEAKVKALQDQAAKAGADAKARIEEQIANVREENARRSAKLGQAAELTEEALKP